MICDVGYGCKGLVLYGEYCVGYNSESEIISELSTSLLEGSTGNTTQRYARPGSSHGLCCPPCTERVAAVCRFTGLESLASDESTSGSSPVRILEND